MKIESTDVATLDYLKMWIFGLIWQIYAYLRTLAATYPSSVTLISGGSSFQGREILGVRLQTGSQPASQSVFIEANIHAREWYNY